MNERSVESEARPLAGAADLVVAVRTAIDEREPLGRRANALRDAVQEWAKSLGAALQDVDGALAAVSAEPSDAVRRVLRVVSAVALARSPGVERLFSSEAGWDDGRAEDLEDYLVYAAAIRPTSEQDQETLAAIGRRPERPLRIAALECRMRIARQAGIEREALASLVEEALAEGGSNRSIKRGAADLVWKYDAQDLIAPLFDRFPALRRDKKMAPIAARLMTLGPKRLLDGGDRKAVKEAARKIERIERASATFWEGLSDPSLRIAVVGNSNCEAGLGRGAEIDAHQFVIRFNLAPEDGSFAADYGARCDVKVLNLENAPAELTATRAPYVALKTQSQIARDVDRLDMLADAGKTIVFVPATLNMSLRRSLGSVPSTGLIVLAHLRAVRGSLKGVSLFGFSLVDLLDRSVARNYFAEQYGATDMHAWAAERALLDEWLEEARA